MVSIRFRALALASYLLFLVPLAIFFWGWLRWHYAALATACIVAGFIWLYRKDYLDNSKSLQIPLKHLISIVAVLGLYAAYSGNCGIGASQYDIPWRSIFLTDLIDYDWPVVYDTGYALTYYLAFWMLPALVGKVFGVGAGFFAMWLYETAILSCAAGLFSHLLGASRPRDFWLVSVVLMLFAGLNILGAAIGDALGVNQMGLYSNEDYLDNFFSGQSTNFYYRSNIDVIEECYNQMMFWLAVPLMLESRKIHSFVFIGAILAPFSPWACIGLIPLMVCIAVQELAAKVRSNSGRALPWVACEVFSPANVLAVLSVGVVFGAYLVASLVMATSHTTGVAASYGIQQSGSFGLLDFSRFEIKHWCAYALFCFCEFVVFAALLFKDERKNPLFWVVVAWLFVCPLVWVGTISGRDFCMDASLPALCVLMFLIMRKMKSALLDRPPRANPATVALVVVMAVAMLSPVLQLVNQAGQLIESKSLHSFTSDIGMTTFNGVDISDISNFVCENPEESFFYQHLAKKG